MGRVYADELGEHQIESQSETFQAISQNPIGCLCLLVRVRPSVNECSDRLPSGGIRDRNFVKVGLRVSADPENSYAVFAVGSEIDGREIGDDIRSDVRLGIAHFIKQ